jgi:hypothetical protein
VGTRRVGLRGVGGVQGSMPRGGKINKKVT